MVKLKVPSMHMDPITVAAFDPCCMHSNVRIYRQMHCCRYVAKRILATPVDHLFIEVAAYIVLSGRREFLAQRVCCFNLTGVKVWH